MAEHGTFCNNDSRPGALFAHRLPKPPDPERVPSSTRPGRLYQQQQLFRHAVRIGQCHPHADRNTGIFCPPTQAKRVAPKWPGRCPFGVTTGPREKVVLKRTLTARNGGSSCSSARKELQEPTSFSWKFLKTLACNKLWSMDHQ